MMLIFADYKTLKSQKLLVKFSKQTATQMLKVAKFCLLF